MEMGTVVFGSSKVFCALPPSSSQQQKVNEPPKTAFNKLNDHQDKANLIEQENNQATEWQSRALDVAAAEQSQTHFS